MEQNKINVAALLKDCPKGTKLYSPICGEYELEELKPKIEDTDILIRDPEITTLMNKIDKITERDSDLSTIELSWLSQAHVNLSYAQGYLQNIVDNCEEE